MPAEQKTMTAPRAIIKVNGQAIGYMKNIKLTETINRGSVMGIGRLVKRELPALSITCTWNCDFYLIDMSRTGVPGLNKRKVQSMEQYQDTLMLFETPVDIYIYKKEKDAVTTEGIVTSTIEAEFAILRDVYLNSESVDISENQISGQNQSGEYLDPVIYTI